MRGEYMSMFEVGGYYPPTEEEDRIFRIHKNKEVIAGNHFPIFKEKEYALNDIQQELLYITINLPALICRKSSDLLFGEHPTYSAGKKDKSNEQVRLDRFITENDLRTTFHESSFANGYRGDTFFKVRYGTKYNGLVDEKYDANRVIIDKQRAEYVFIELIPGTDTVLAYHIGIPRVIEGTGDQRWVLDVERHYIGKLTYAQYELEPFRFSHYENRIIQWKIIKENQISRPDVEVEIPEHLIVHIPNPKADDMVYGVDDITEHFPLYDELNSRLSAIASILDRHSDPMLVLPEDMIEKDEEGAYSYDSSQKAVGMKDKNDVVPQYVTWEASLNAAFTELEFTFNKILLLAEIPDVAVGASNSGTSGSTGLAIKQRLAPILSKVNRKRMYFDQGIKKLIYVAQLLEHAKSREKLDYEVFTPVINWKDGLPDDEREKAQVVQLRTNGKATLSLKTALITEYGLTEEQADEEIKRIRDEDEAENSLETSVDRFRKVDTQQDPLVNQNAERKGLE